MDFLSEPAALSAKSNVPASLIVREPAAALGHQTESRKDGGKTLPLENRTRF